MTTVNLHEKKADYFEEMSETLFVTHLLRRIYLKELVLEEYDIDIVKKSVKEAQNQIQKYLRENHESLSVFSEGFIQLSLDMEHIEDPGNILILANANLALSEIYRLFPKGIKTNKSEYELWNIEQKLIERSYKTLGYWVAKTEDYAPVLEANIKRRQKTQRKFREFVKICVEYKIYSAEDFKGDKSKRQKFFDEVKEKLDLFSERRILDYLKEFQKKQENGEIIRVSNEMFEELKAKGEITTLPNGEIIIKSREKD